MWRVVEDVGKAGGSASLPARAFDWRLADHRKHARSTSGMTALAIRNRKWLKSPGQVAEQGLLAENAVNKT